MDLEFNIILGGDRITECQVCVELEGVAYVAYSPATWHSPAEGGGVEGWDKVNILEVTLSNDRIELSRKGNQLAGRRLQVIKDLVEKYIDENPDVVHDAANELARDLRDYGPDY